MISAAMLVADPWRGNSSRRHQAETSGGLLASPKTTCPMEVLVNQMPSFPGAGPADAAPPQIRFSLDGVPERERRSQVREFFGRELTKYDVEPEPDAPLDIDVTFRVLPGLIMMSGRGHGYRANRGRESIAAEASDDIGLAINLGGPFRVAGSKREFVLGDYEAVTVSLAEPYCFTHRPPGRILALRVPRSQIAPLVTGVDDLCHRHIPAGVPALKFLLDYVKVAEGEQFGSCPELQHLFVSHVCDLMALTIGATRDAAELAKGGGLRAARLNAIKQDIATNLDHPGLSVTVLAARHGLTSRFVQRLFEAEGTTFTDYVLSQRLLRAHRMLNDPRRACDKISVIAWDCGFGDISHFNHVFRRRYGLAPSEVRAQARRGRQ
jgi:AraC-like DNA-binding protein